MIYPGVQLKAVEGNPLPTNRDLGEVRADLNVEAVAVHADVAWGIAKAKQAWCKGQWSFHDGPPVIYRPK